MPFPPYRTLLSGAMTRQYPHPTSSHLRSWSSQHHTHLALGEVIYTRSFSQLWNFGAHKFSELTMNWFNRLPHRKVGSAVTISCEDGYKLFGSEESVCKDDGQWSEELPTCVSQLCEVTKARVALWGNTHKARVALWGNTRILESWQYDYRRQNITIILSQALPPRVRD